MLRCLRHNLHLGHELAHRPSNRKRNGIYGGGFCNRDRSFILGHSRRTLGNKDYGVTYIPADGLFRWLTRLPLAPKLVGYCGLLVRYLIAIWNC